MSLETSAEPLTHVNDELVPKSEAKISVFDEGVTHGRAVYMGIRVHDPRIGELDAHIRRLHASAKGAGIETPLTPWELKAVELYKTYIRENWEMIKY